MNPKKDYSPLEVRIPDWQSGDPDALVRAINKLKRKVANEKVLKEARRRSAFEKPSDRRRRKEREARKRMRKKGARR